MREIPLLLGLGGAGVDTTRDLGAVGGGGGWGGILDRVSRGGGAAGVFLAGGGGGADLGADTATLDGRAGGGGGARPGVATAVGFRAGILGGARVNGETGEVGAGGGGGGVARDGGAGVGRAGALGGLRVGKLGAGAAGGTGAALGGGGARAGGVGAESVGAGAARAGAGGARAGGGGARAGAGGARAGGDAGVARGIEGGFPSVGGLPIVVVRFIDTKSDHQPYPDYFVLLASILAFLQQIILQVEVHLHPCLLRGKLPKPPMRILPLLLLHLHLLSVCLWQVHSCHLFLPFSAFYQLELLQGARRRPWKMISVIKKGAFPGSNKVKIKRPCPQL